MERIKLKTFELEEYDSSNIDHQKFATYFESDEEYTEYMEPFWSLENSVNYAKRNGKYSAVYYAYLDGILVGMVGLISILDMPEVVISILKEHRGNHYSRYLYQEYAEYVLKFYKEYKAIYASIQPENIPSSKNALAAGFKQIDEYKYIKR